MILGGIEIQQQEGIHGTPKGKSSRLDYWLISDHLLNEIHSFDIIPDLRSDHSISKITQGNNDLLRGKGFWKFNNSLHDTYYVNQIKNIIKNCEDEYSTLEDKAFAWDMTKLKIRSFSISYCVKKGENIEFKKSLENELEILHNEIDSDTSNVNHETYHSKKR